MSTRIPDGCYTGLLLGDAVVLICMGFRLRGKIKDVNAKTTTEVKVIARDGYYTCYGYGNVENLKPLWDAPLWCYW